MSTLSGRSFTGVKNLNIKGQGSTRGGIIRFDGTNSSSPLSSTSNGLYVNASNQLIYSSQGTTTVIGTAGVGGTPSWETLFAADATFNVAGTTFTIDNSTGNNDVLTITNSGAGSGDAIQITNAGTGKDINGSSATWSVTKAGAAVFTDIDTPLITSSAALTIAGAGANVITIGANTNTITMAKATTFSSTITVTDGLTTLISTSNTAQALLVTNNTVTTYGAGGADAGVVVIRSTSLTTGDLLKLQTDASLTAGQGNYISCYDTGLSAEQFTVSELGAVTIAGGADTTMITVSAGDVVVSAGSVAITDDDNAVVLDVVNNTATTAAVARFASTTATFTGTTTGSYMLVSHTGLTSGTLLRLAAAAADTSVGVVDIAVVGLTSGSALRITTDTATFTTGGKMIELTSTAAVAGNHLTATTTGAYTGTGMILVTAGAATTGVLVSVISTTGLTTGSLIRATTSTAGILATNGAISFTATGAFTSTSAVDGGFVEVKANSTTAGTIVNVVGSGLTTGIGLQLSNGTSGMTSGSMIRVTASGTGTIATNGIVSIRHAGIYVSTGNVGVLDVVSSALVGAGTVVRFAATAASQTAAEILNITQSGATLTAYTGSLVSITAGFSGSSSTGSAVLITAVNTTAGDALKIVSNAVTLGAATLINLSHTTSVLGAGSSMLRITSTGIDTGTTTGVLLDLASTASTAATQILGTFSAQQTGNAVVFSTAALTSGTILQLKAVEATLTTGLYLQCYDGAAADFSVAKYGATVIAGNALGTAALTVTAGDLIITSGNTHLGGRVIYSATETIAAGGTSTALSLTKTVHYIDADAGGDTFTLADGIAGQIMTILLTSSTGTATVTPANLAGGTSVTLNADGDSVVLQFMDTEWFILGGNSYAVA